MSTTITMAYLVWPQLYLIHAGDSRAYVHRNNELIRLTHDQTYAQTLVDAGLMKDSELRTSPLRNVLSGLVGGDPSHFHPEITQFKLNLHDKLLLCTDGLTAHVTETQIAQMLCEERTSEDACQRLIDCANEAGGRDNITVVLVQFTDDSKPQARARMEEQSIPEPEQGAPVRQLLVESLTVSQESMLGN